MSNEVSKTQNPTGTNDNDEVYDEYMKNIYFQKNFKELGQKFHKLEGKCDTEIKRQKHMFLNVLEALAEKLNDQLLLGKDGDKGLGSKKVKGQGLKGGGEGLGGWDYEAPRLEKMRFLNGIRDRVGELHKKIDNL
jgi:hypothetical protein